MTAIEGISIQLNVNSRVLNLVNAEFRISEQQFQVGHEKFYKNNFLVFLSKHTVGQRLTVSAIVAGSIPNCGNELFSFSRSGNKTMRGLELLNTQLGTECLNTKFLQPILLYMA